MKRWLRYLALFSGSLAVGLVVGHGVAAVVRTAADPGARIAASAAVLRVPLSLTFPAAPQRPAVLRPLVAGPPLPDRMMRSGKAQGHRAATPVSGLVRPGSVPGEAAAVLGTALRPRMPPSRLPDGPRVAIVIDDIGFDRAAGMRVVALPGAVSLSILPYAPHGAELAWRARRAGHRVMLHLPMEPRGAADPGPMALRSGLPEGELIRRVLWAFARVPGADGVNNHMGSRFTEDADGLRPVMGEIAAQGAFFLDSVTSPRSQAYAVARDLGVPALRRDVFLDHELDPRVIAARLAETEATARERGHAIAIGHPYPETLDALAAWMPAAAARGIAFVSAADLAAHLGAASEDDVALLPAAPPGGEAEGFLGSAE